MKLNKIPKFVNWSQVREFCVPYCRYSPKNNCFWFEIDNPKFVVKLHQQKFNARISLMHKMNLVTRSFFLSKNCTKLVIFCLFT